MSRNPMWGSDIYVCFFSVFVLVRSGRNLAMRLFSLSLSLSRGVSPNIYKEDLNPRSV
jgi:hypothetical protein